MRVWASIGLLLAGLVPVFGQENASNSSPDLREMQKRTAAQAARIKAQNEEMRARNDKMDEQMAQTLKQSNPQMYEAWEAQRQERKRVQKTIEAFRAGRIDENAARERLRPDVQRESQGFLQNLDQTIADQEKKVAALKSVRANPDQFVQQRIDAMLGKGVDPFARIGPIMPSVRTPPRATAPADQQQ